LVGQGAFEGSLAQGSVQGNLAEGSVQGVQLFKELKSDQRCRIGLFLPRVPLGSGEVVEPDLRWN